MIYWNIFTVLCGALIAALSPRAWKPLVTKAREQQIPLLLLTTISMGAFIFLWSIFGFTLFQFGVTRYTQPAWTLYAFIVNLIIFSSCAIPLGLVQLVINFMGRKLVDRSWKISFSMTALIAVILFGVGANLLGTASDIMGMKFLSTFSLWLVLGATVWLLFVIKTDNTKTISRAITGISLAAIVSITLYVTNLSEPIKSIIATTIKETHHYGSGDLI